MNEISGRNLAGDFVMTPLSKIWHGIKLDEPRIRCKRDPRVLLKQLTLRSHAQRRARVLCAL